jgi:succinate dehydrogenase / fumarate reductase cytochrome b subunit
MSSTRNRPLSPHLFIYRLPPIAFLSVSHRGTGVVLAMGMLFVACWLGSLAAGPQVYATTHWLLSTIIAKLGMFGFTFCLFYHLCHGIRHLLWDIGCGYELPAVRAANLASVAVSGALTVAVWIAALA